MSPCEPNGFPVIGTVTVDSATDSLNWLPAVRNLFPGARAHTNTATAFDGVLALVAADGTMVGKGTEGVFHSGGGGETTSDAERIWMYNITQWTDTSDGLTRGGARQVAQLMVCVCDVGAALQGANLLYALARLTNATVVAPTGFVYVDAPCRQLYLEPGATFQKAGPDEFPSEIIPTPKPRADQLQAVICAGRPQVIPAINIVAAQFVSMTARFISPAINMLSSLPAVHFDTPFRASRATLAIVTGTLTLTFLYQERPRSREFHVLNGRILRDAALGDYYYYATRAATF